MNASPTQIIYIRLERTDLSPVEFRQAIAEVLAPHHLLLNSGFVSKAARRTLMACFQVADLPLALIGVKSWLEKEGLLPFAEIATLDTEDGIFRTFYPVSSLPFDRHFRPESEAERKYYIHVAWGALIVAPILGWAALYISRQCAWGNFTLISIGITLWSARLMTNHFRPVSRH